MIEFIVKISYETQQLCGGIAFLFSTFYNFFFIHSAEDIYKS